MDNKDKPESALLKNPTKPVTLLCTSFGNRFPIQSSIITYKGSRRKPVIGIKIINTILFR